MGRLFKVSGHIIENGIWPKPKFNFYGEIVLDGEIFFGYCNKMGTKKPCQLKIFWLALLLKTKKITAAQLFTGCQMIPTKVPSFHCTGLKSFRE